MNSNGENSQKSYKNKISMELEESRNNIQKCKSCDMSFDHRTKLKGHIRKFHNQKSLRGNSCENLFLCPADLRRHRETVKVLLDPFFQEPDQITIFCHKTEPDPITIFLPAK